MGLDLGSSWMVGDTVSDLLAGINARCRGSILVRTGKGLSKAEEALGVEHQVADDLLAATELIRTNRQPTSEDNGAGPARMKRSDTLRREPR